MENAISIKSEVEQIKITNENFSTENLQVALPNGKILLKDFNFELTQGTRILITGETGCGKSTLLKTISGIWPFGKGKIFSSGKTVNYFYRNALICHWELCGRQFVILLKLKRIRTNQPLHCTSRAKKLCMT